MGRLQRRRDRRRAERAEAEAAYIREQIANTRDLFVSGGDFDLRALVEDLFAGKPIYSVQILAETFGMTADKFYSGANLPEQWDGQTREAREDRLLQDIRFTNRYEDVDYGENAEMLGLHAGLKTKVLVFAWAVDSLYGTDYSERVYTDPLQFGTVQLDSDA